MSLRVSLFPAILLAASAAVGLPAQTASVSIPAWVEGKECGAHPDFRVTVNGEPAAVTSALGPSSDQIILLVFDLTGSLSRIAAAKQAVIAAISKLPPNAWVGVLRDQDGLHVVEDPSPSRRPVLAAITTLSNSGEPGLLETVDSALSLADAIVRQAPVRVSVLYLTDGSIYEYREDYTNPVINPSDPYDLSRAFPGALVDGKISNLLRDLRPFEAPLFVVHLESRGDPLNEVYQSGLESLTKATGGKAEICHSASEIPDAIAAMFGRISSAWRLTLAVPPKSGKNLRIHLMVPCSKGEVRLSWRTDLDQKGNKP